MISVKTNMKSMDTTKRRSDWLIFLQFKLYNSIFCLMIVTGPHDMPVI